jgi:hypothetical protein
MSYFFAAKARKKIVNERFEVSFFRKNELYKQKAIF